MGYKIFKQYYHIFAPNKVGKIADFSEIFAKSLLQIRGQLEEYRRMVIAKNPL